MPLHCVVSSQLLLSYCSPSDPKALWDKFKSQLTEDHHNTIEICVDVGTEGLRLINFFLVGLGRLLSEYNLMTHNLSNVVLYNRSSELEYEQNIEVLDADFNACAQLNHSQRKAFTSITESVYYSESKVFLSMGQGAQGRPFFIKYF